VIFNEHKGSYNLHGKSGDETLTVYANGGVSIRNKEGKALTGTTAGVFKKKSSYNGVKEFLDSYKKYKRMESEDVK